MAILTGTVIGSALHKPANQRDNANGEKLQIILEVDCGATLVATAANGRPDHLSSRAPTNLDGRAVSVTVDDGTLQVTAIGIT